MHVEGFDSLDEMFASMAAHEDAANLSLTPGQVALRDDVENTRYWVQGVPDYDLVIYGVAQPNFIVKRSAGFDVDENRERGYLTGTAYSTDEPRGEYGDTHVSQVIPIDKTTFLLAQTLGWPRYSELRDEDNRTLGILLAEAERVALGRE